MKQHRLSLQAVVELFLYLSWISHCCGKENEILQFRILGHGVRSSNVWESTLNSSSASLQCLLNTTFIEFVDTNDESTLFTSRKVSHRMDKENGSKHILWHGTTDNSLQSNQTGSCTLFWSQQEDTISGTITTSSASFEILQYPKGTKKVRWMYWNEFPPDDDEDDEEEGSDFDFDTDNIEEGKDRDLEASQNTNGTSVEGSTAEVVSWTDRYTDWKSVDDDLVSNRRLETLVDDEKRQTRGLVDIPIIDVLIIISHQGMCEYAQQPAGCALTKYGSIIENKIPVVEAETNQALAKSQASIKVVGTIFLSSTSYKYDPSSASLAMLRQDTNIQSWRNVFGADLVAMIGAGGGGSCGKSSIPGVYSITANICLGQYSWTHELGHNFGCLHDRASCTESHPYAHGFQYKDKFRTIMTYRSVGANVPRILEFSSSVNKYETFPLGNATNDNSRMIKEQALRISNLKARPAVPIPVACRSFFGCGGQTRMYKRFSTTRCTQLCVNFSNVTSRLTNGWKCGLCP